MTPRTAIIGGVLGTGAALTGGVGYVASDPNTSVVLVPIDRTVPGYVDDEACKACDFDIGVECWCPPPGQPITEAIVCGCYTPLPEGAALPPDPEPPAPEVTL